jgi:hypothetical protein
VRHSPRKQNQGFQRDRYGNSDGEKFSTSPKTRQFSGQPPAANGQKFSG